MQTDVVRALMHIMLITFIISSRCYFEALGRFRRRDLDVLEALALELSRREAGISCF